MCPHKMKLVVNKVPVVAFRACTCGSLMSCLSSQLLKLKVFLHLVV